jgi:hypothetical protein
MLAAVLASTLLRTAASWPSVTVAVGVLAGTVFAGAALHDHIRKSSNAQAASALALALSGAPIEAAGGLAYSDIAGATATRLVVFATSLLIVRAAFARSARAGARRAALLQGGALALPLATTVGFALLGALGEALASAVAAVIAVVTAAFRPNAKRLKPLGLTLALLALATALVLVI